MRRITITSGKVKLGATLDDSPTADAVWAALPFSARAETWGEEVYFPTPVKAKREPGARTTVEAGELAFWLAGDAIAICFGPTPISRGDEIRLYSEANIFGRLEGDAGVLAAIKAGDPIQLDRLT